jgi:hypothetical protein
MCSSIIILKSNLKNATFKKLLFFVNQEISMNLMPSSSILFYSTNTLKSPTREKENQLNVMLCIWKNPLSWITWNTAISTISSIGQSPTGHMKKKTRKINIFFVNPVPL